jgi:hypothetical protein
MTFLACGTYKVAQETAHRVQVRSAHAGTLRSGLHVSSSSFTVEGMKTWWQPYVADLRFGAREMLKGLSAVLAPLLLVGCSVLGNYDTIVAKDQACEVLWTRYIEMLERWTKHIEQILAIAASDGASDLTIRQAISSSTRPPASHEVAGPLSPATLEVFERSQETLADFACSARKVGPPGSQSATEAPEILLESQNLERQVRLARNQYVDAAEQYNRELSRNFGRVLDRRRGVNFETRVIYPRAQPLGACRVPN